jgi:3-(3-hydroxy-phenyl)propionate hydroxylase
MLEHQVVIAGGGPTGMMLAAELALAKIDVALIERRTTQDLIGFRAGGLHARTIEVFEQRGIADRFLSQGRLHHKGVTFGHNFICITDLPSRHNYFLGLPQQKIEHILAAWVTELGVKTLRGCEVTSFTQTEDAVNITLSDNTSVSAHYLVGCDGGRSTIRKAAGITFTGSDPTKSWLIAEALFTEDPPLGFREDAHGSYAIGKADDGAAMRLVLTERDLNTNREPTLDDVRHMLIASYGTDFGIHSPISISRFTDATRQAATYRDRRVLLAGDAAHVHPPMGGQGLNIGVQDAVNLGWKLAQVVKHISSESLLDTYQAERHPVAARVLRYTLAQVAFQRTDDRTKALGEIFAEYLASDDLRKRISAENAGLSVHYDLGPTSATPHPLLGRRMSDLDLITAEGPIRVFTLLHNARPILLNFSTFNHNIQPWSDRVTTTHAEYHGEWTLPIIGKVFAPKAVLMRPDGYVAWVGEGTDTGLPEALTAWFGPPKSA